MPSFAVPDKKEESKVLLYNAMASAGVQAKVKVLYVGDYVTDEARVRTSALVWREVSEMLPQFEVSLAFSAGPFEDAAGGAFAHFDGSKHGVLTPAKQVLEAKRIC